MAYIANLHILITSATSFVTFVGENLTTESVEAFLKEGMIMKDFIHTNVLSLIGVTIDNHGVPAILLPYMHHGSLKTYIKNPNVYVSQ